MGSQVPGGGRLVLGAEGGGGPLFKNPVLAPDHPDPAVLGPLPNGYILVTTLGDGDIDVFTSTNLQTWSAHPVGIFNATPPAGAGYSVQLVRDPVDLSPSSPTFPTPLSDRV